MIATLLALLAIVRDIVRRRADLELELLALRHQVVVLNNFRLNAFLPGDPEAADTFTYKANDGASDSNVATSSVTRGMVPIVLLRGGSTGESGIGA